MTIGMRALPCVKCDVSQPAVGTRNEAANRGADDSR